MAIITSMIGRSNKARTPKIELIPVLETETQFNARKEEVQILLVQMFLRSKKRGRPSKEDKENFYEV